MGTTRALSKPCMTSPPTKRWRKPRRWLAGFIGCLILVPLFYAEENWRGEKAWEVCKRAVKASGVELTWSNYIPAEVPDDENVFGVPEMERWFKGGGAATWSDLASRLPSPTFPGLNIDSNTARVLVAEVTIGRPGIAAPEGLTVLRWEDPASQTKAARLVTNALGPTARAPQSSVGVGLMTRRPGEVHAAQIFLQCQIVPTEKELQAFLPDTIIHADANLPERVLKFEPNGNGAYRVTMPVLARAADYLTWSDGLEPEFALIRQALQRPYSRMHGAYENPNTVPGPNFRAARNLAQTLGARAQCHLLLGDPGKALSELTLVRDFCRIYEEHKPMTLVSAMLNAAVTGLYATQMGAVAVLRAVSKCGVHADALIIESVFDRMLSTVQNRFEKMHVPAFPCAQLLIFWGGHQAGFNAFDHNPLDYARDVRCPALFLHGSADTRAKPSEARRVFAAVSASKRFREFNGLGHESAADRFPAQWKSVVREFLAGNQRTDIK